MKKIVAGLLALNAGLFFLARDDPPTDLNALQIRITSIEQTLPLREANAAWLERVQPLLGTAPEEDPNELLGRLRDLASGWHFEITEAANRGGTPANVVFVGRGSYQAIVALIAEIERSDGARLDAISLTRRDDEAIDATFEIAVRKGPWQELSCDQRPEPATETASIHLLGNDPFNAPKVEAPTPTTKPQLRFKGFFSGASGITAIVETENKVLLLTPGEQLPSGGSMVTASTERLEIQDGRGARWTYDMEKTR